MPEKTLSKEEETVAQTKAEKFDIDKALNTKGFAEFLAAYPEAESFDMRDGSEVERRFETFKAKEFVRDNLKSLYSSHIEREMGIKLDGNDLTSVDEYIETQAVQNPEEVIEIKNRLEAFIELPRQINELERQLARLGKAEELSANLESFKKDRDNLAAQKKYSGLFGKTRLAYHLCKTVVKGLPIKFDEVLNTGLLEDEYIDRATKEKSEIFESWNAAGVIREKYGDMDNRQTRNLESKIRNQIEKREKTLAAVQQVEELKSASQEMFGNIRKELLSGVSNVAELTVAIQEKASSQFQEMMRGGSIEKLDLVQKRFESLKSVAQSTETGVNPLGGIDEELLQERVDASLEKVASEEIMQTVLRANMGANALAKMEKALEPFLKREKIGSKDGDDARELISNILKEVAQNLGGTTEDKAKKLMIVRILIKIRS